MVQFFWRGKPKVNAIEMDGQEAPAVSLLHERVSDLGRSLELAAVRFGHDPANPTRTSPAADGGGGKLRMV